MNFIIILDIFAVLFQLAAAYFAFRIYRFNRLSKWWIALIVAFLVQAVRRGIQIYSDLGYGSLGTSLDRSLMLLISVLMVMGLWAMMKNFEQFDIVSSKVKEKLKKMK